MNRLELTGRADSHITHYESLSFAAEEKTANAFLEMKKQAEKDGLSLQAYSAFRDFNSQLAIWNAKFSGERALYSSDSKLLDFDSLSEEQLVHTILAWSALPGGSRHHWGTDIDVIDAAAIPPDYQVKLLPEEYGEGGVFYKLNDWLEENREKFGFFKPYREFRGGICEEPWHLSYAPVSKELMSDLTVDLIQEAISDSDLLGKKLVLNMLPILYKTFVINVCE